MARPARTLLLVGAAFAGGAVVDGGRVWAEAEGHYRALSVFARVLGYVERNYIEQVPVERLIRAAIRGVVAELDQPSSYLEPDAYAALQAEARPDFGGIGVVMTRRESVVVVTEVHPESPAARAGLKPGDRVESVDGRAVRGQPLSRVMEWITGVPGTRVALRVLPTGSKDERAVSLVRARVFPSTVTGRRFGSVGYLRLLRFDERTSRDLFRSLGSLRDDGPLQGLVLDLRGNPGGLLDQAIRVADAWLDKGTIVSTLGRQRSAETAAARDRGTEPDYPMAVLIDDGTASAAEIVAGALQDRGRARLFGQTSFGKGSVQTLIELEDGSALKLTVARYLTPSGRSIEGTGIVPDVALHENPETFRLAEPSRDQTLRTALRWFEGPARMAKPDRSR